MSEMENEMEATIEALGFRVYRVQGNVKVILWVSQCKGPRVSEASPIQSSRLCCLTVRPPERSCRTVCSVVTSPISQGIRNSGTYSRTVPFR